MLKRCKRAYRIVRMKKLCFVCSVFLCAFCFGCRYNVIDGVEDYQAFLHSYTRYDNAVSEDPADIPQTIEEIAGFAALYNGTFSFGKQFDGGVAFVRKGDDNFLLLRSGELWPASEDLTNTTLCGDMYSFAEGAYIGVRNAYGAIVLPPQYDRVEIAGNTILAIRENRAETYTAQGKRIGEHCFAQNVRLADATHVYCDETFYSLDFAKLSVNGCAYLDIPCDDLAVVDCGDGYVTYGNVVTQRLFSGRFLQARRFSQGHAVVRLETGEEAVLDTHGNILYVTHTRKIGDKNGAYHCYLQYNMYGVMDAAFQDVIGPAFAQVRYEQAVNGYLIVPYGQGERLYNLRKLAYESALYERIEYADGLFFGYSDDKVTVFDADLRVITVCDNATWGEGVLSVCKGGKYTYYVQEVQI